MQEVLIDYGHSRSNLDLMCDYGFIVPGNGGDRVLSGELKHASLVDARWPGDLHSWVLLMTHPGALLPWSSTYIYTSLNRLEASPVPCRCSTLAASSSSPQPGKTQAGRDNTGGLAATAAAPFSRCRAAHHGFNKSFLTLIIRASGTAIRITAIAASISREARRWSRSMQGAHQSCTSVTGCPHGAGGRH